MPDPDMPQRVIEFIGEACSVPFSDEASAKLVRGAAGPAHYGGSAGPGPHRILRAECQVQPVLLVLEDLHWGDALTIKLIDIAALAREQPFMVLALARPEICESCFPSMWAGPGAADSAARAEPQSAGTSGAADPGDKIGRRHP